jgi:hypothetical protein
MYGMYEKLEKLPPGEKQIDTKWVLAIKKNNDRTIEKYKARKEVRDFIEENQKHYDQTSAQVA